MRKALTVALATSLAIAPVASAAAATDASPLSLASAPGSARAGPDPQQPNALGGDTLIFVALGVAAIILFFVLIDDDDDDPSSP